MCFAIRRLGGKLGTELQEHVTKSVGVLVAYAHVTKSVGGCGWVAYAHDQPCIGCICICICIARLVVRICSVLRHLLFVLFQCCLLSETCLQLFTPRVSVAKVLPTARSTDSNCPPPQSSCYLPFPAAQQCVCSLPDQTAPCSV